MGGGYLASIWVYVSRWEVETLTLFRTEKIITQVPFLSLTTLFRINASSKSNQSYIHRQYLNIRTDTQKTILISLFGSERAKAIPRIVKKILSSRRIRESSWYVFPGGVGRGRHITIDTDKQFNPG